MRLSVFAILVATAIASPAFAQAPPAEEFNSDKLDWSLWCPCQIDLKHSPITFETSADGVRHARIPVDENSLGGNKCLPDLPHLECRDPDAVAFVAAGLLSPGASAPPDLPDPLGPSFFAPSTEVSGRSLVVPKAPAAAETDPYCDDVAELRAHRHHEEDECIQRQELRFQKFKPLAGDPYLYSMRFRLPEHPLPDGESGSTRWVIAQWKEEPLSDDYQDRYGPDWGPSPFLAVRFDNGVLHITVQDEECRCVIASAPDPFTEVAGWKPDGHGGSIPRWRDGPATMCESSKAGVPAHTACSVPPKLELAFGPDPVLSSARGQWIELNFRVQADVREGSPATIVVREGERPIVTVVGRIGYAYYQPEPGDRKRTVTKFKIGHYRDYVPFPATLDVDWLKVEKATD